MDSKYSLKKDGKVVVTISVEVTTEDLKFHDIKKSELDKIQKCIEYRFDGHVGLFWDDFSSSDEFTRFYSVFGFAHSPRVGSADLP